jgi:2-succinyl-6-hydroxy-2,4-cyclohexadiene-1-carboxylate synthase
MPSYWSRLPTIDVPVGLVVGAMDHRFRTIAETALSHLRRGRLFVVDAAGHNVPFERPDEVARILSGTFPEDRA